MAVGKDDGGTACAQSLSELLDTQGGKQMADVITGQPESAAVAAAAAWATEFRKYAVETIGSFFLTFVVVVSVLSHSAFTPLAAGAALMVMIYAGGHISGGHYNPAVTMGALVRGRIGVVEAVGYWIAQIAGGVVAGWVGRAVVNPSAVSTLTLTGHAEAAAAVAELLITFALCYVMLNVATSKDQPGNGFFGLAIGFTVTAGAFAVGGISGGVFNPQVALGGATAGVLAWSTIWVYVVVQLGAGIAAGLAFLLLNPGDGALRTYTGGPNRVFRHAGSKQVPAPRGSSPSTAPGLSEARVSASKETGA
jgi:aquaporin Z